jgi:SAM-dependent methyltransferase
MDLISEMPPTVKVHGIDIEGNRFPKSYPSNVSFSIGSILSLPPDWTKKFDFVHQRLLMSGLKREQWPVAISEIYRALKPGGWAQLGEYGCWGYGAGPASDAHFRIYNQLYKHNGLALRIFAEIPDMLRDADFTNVHFERRAYLIGGEAGKEGRFNLIGHFRSVVPQVMRYDGFGLVQSEEQYEGIITAMEREWERLDSAESEVVYVWAQKPTDA